MLEGIGLGVFTGVFVGTGLGTGVGVGIISFCLISSLLSFSLVLLSSNWICLLSLYFLNYYYY